MCCDMLQVVNTWAGSLCGSGRRKTPRLATSSTCTLVITGNVRRKRTGRNVQTSTYDIQPSLDLPLVSIGPAALGTVLHCYIQIKRDGLTWITTVVFLWHDHIM